MAVSDGSDSDSSSAVFAVVSTRSRLCRRPHKKDHAGTFFRRNRYYDPVTGKFTQEDPIGLAGGLNVYGFAAGDPVSYGDPYGLKVCFRGTAGEVEALRSATEEAVSADVTLDSNNCISEVGAARNRSLAALRNRLALLAGVNDKYEVRFEKGPGERAECRSAQGGECRTGARASWGSVRGGGALRPPWHTLLSTSCLVTDSRTTHTDRRRIRSRRCSPSGTPTTSLRRPWAYPSDAATDRSVKR
jgi:RHS repeat-associated protein